MRIEYFFSEKIRKNPEQNKLIHGIYEKYREEIEDIDDTIFSYGTYGAGSLMVIGLATVVIGDYVLKNKEILEIGAMISSLGGTIGGLILGMGIGGIVTAIKEKRFYKKIEEELRLENKIT